MRELLEATGKVTLVDDPVIKVIPDDLVTIGRAIKDMCEGPPQDDREHNGQPVAAGLVLTTGGTGFAPRDVTPEATAAVLERRSDALITAVHAAMLPRLPSCVLSRGIAGTLGRSLVINCPGKPKAVRETVEVLARVLPHALDQLRGSIAGHGGHVDDRKGGTGSR